MTEAVSEIRNGEEAVATRSHSCFCSLYIRNIIVMEILNKSIEDSCVYEIDMAMSYFRIRSEY